MGGEWVIYEKISSSSYQLHDNNYNDGCYMKHSLRLNLTFHDLNNYHQTSVFPTKQIFNRKRGEWELYKKISSPSSPLQNPT